MGIWLEAIQKERQKGLAGDQEACPIQSIGGSPSRCVCETHLPTRTYSEEVLESRGEERAEDMPLAMGRHRSREDSLCHNDLSRSL